MVSQYMFGVSRTKPSREVAEQIERIAEENECTWVEARIPGDGYKSWFTCRNMGHPYTTNRERDVYAALTAAGIELA